MTDWLWLFLTEHWFYLAIGIFVALLILAVVRPKVADNIMWTIAMMFLLAGDE